MIERNTTPPNTSDIASKRETIRAGWTRQESRVRRDLAAVKQQQLFRKILVRSPATSFAGSV